MYTLFTTESSLFFAIIARRTEATQYAHPLLYLFIRVGLGERRLLCRRKSTPPSPPLFPKPPDSAAFSRVVLGQAVKHRLTICGRVLHLRRTLVVVTY